MAKWEKVHKSSGASAYEQRANKCRLTVIPADWTSPKGKASWSVTCGDWRDTRFEHKRGEASTVARAKAAAARAAKKLRKK